ncbi:MAG: restriction endonuclease [Ottowia sp.]|nr:restriction endonuclease [Ottowia sp.]
MSIPDYETLMLPLLRLAGQGDIKIGEAVEKLADEFKLDAKERARLLRSGRQSVISSRVGWARTYLLKAQLLELVQRGVYRITARGREVLGENPPRIDTDYLRRFPEFQEFFSGMRKEENDAPPVLREGAVGAPAASTETPEETIRRAHAEMERALEQELLERVQAQTPAFFERLVVRLLVAMGYGGSEDEAERALTLGQSGDHGVDGVIYQDALGLDRIYVQAKRYATGNQVGSPEVRNFAGSLELFKASKGLFVTTSSFSEAAREEVKRMDKHIVLIGGEQLARLMVRYGVGCRLEDSLLLKKIDEDFFE